MTPPSTTLCEIVGEAKAKKLSANISHLEQFLCVLDPTLGPLKMKACRSGSGGKDKVIAAVVDALNKLPLHPTQPKTKPVSGQKRKVRGSEGEKDRNQRP